MLLRRLLEKHVSSVYPLQVQNPLHLQRLFIKISNPMVFIEENGHKNKNVIKWYQKDTVHVLKY